MRISIFAICFFNFLSGLLLRGAEVKYSSDGIYDVYVVSSIKSASQCPETVGPRAISITYGDLVNGHQNCNESASWSSDFHHVDSLYLCQNPTMVDVKIIESVNWDQSGSIGIGTVDIYHYDEADAEVCHSKYITNWVRK